MEYYVKKNGRWRDSATIEMRGETERSDRPERLNDDGDERENGRPERRRGKTTVGRKRNMIHAPMGINPLTRFL